MNEACLKLTTYFGERQRADGGFLADAFAAIHARHGLRTSLVLRGVEGFGAGQHLRTDRLLSLSEDLPLVSVAIDSAPRIEAALREMDGLRFHGLVTLERARLLTGRLDAVELAGDGLEATKLTIHMGRGERVGRTAAYEAVVALLHERGLAGATVLVGVDGTAHGERRRASLLSRNAQVPLMVVCVGDGHRVARVLPEIGAMLERPLVALERVRVCKRDGERRARPERLPDSDAAGLGLWQKLEVYAGGQARHDGRPLSAQLVRGLRAAGAAGATSLRGVWGYHGDHAPHGDSFRQLRRRVPVVTVVVDRPARIQRWFDLVDELTDEGGLVTSETVPAYRATVPKRSSGGVRLAERTA